jgi:hypothetical protein
MLSKSSSPQPSSSSSISGHSSKSKSPPVKPANVFSDDGSFLDRIRRSIKEEDDKRKEKEALERKRQFANRFKNRGKRTAPTPDPTANDNQVHSNKKLKLSDDANYASEPSSPQAKYQKAIGSYSESLKENGTGIRPLVK